MFNVGKGKMEPRELILSLTEHFSAQISQASTPRELNKIFKGARFKFEQLKKDSLSFPNNETVCVTGCAYCCYLTVTLRAHEIVQILEFINTKLTKTEIANIINRAKINMKQMLQLTHDECEHTNFKCPLLSDDGLCMCYEARPFSCQKFNSRDADLCRLFYENPKANISQDSAYGVDMSAAVVLYSLADAFKNNGYDENVYYLNHALYEGLINPKMIKRWRKKKKAFSKNALSKETKKFPINELSLPDD